MLNSRKVIFALSTCMALHMTSFVIILPLFARRFSELGAGVEALGISAMAYALAAAVAAPFMGSLADRFGRRPLALVSLGVHGVTYCVYLLAPSITAFIVLRGLAGAFTAGFTPAVTGLVADLAPDDRRAQWIGFMNAGSSIGWIAGPIAGGMLYDRWGYSVAILVSIIISVISLLAAYLGIPNTCHPSGRSPSIVKKRRTVNQPKSIYPTLINIRNTLPRTLSSFFVLLFIFFAVLFAWSFIEPRFMFYRWAG
jgi:MFS family permease